MPGVQLHWLHGRPRCATGVTWGVPWPSGCLDRLQPVGLRDSLGRPLAVQTWPIAFWPDGSVKWTAHAAVFSDAACDSYVLRREEAAMLENPLAVCENDQSITVDTGTIRCQLNRSGSQIIAAIWWGDTQACSGGQLVCIRESRGWQRGKLVTTEEPLLGWVEKAAVEQEGPIRCVVRVEGRHGLHGNGRGWLPFVARLYFYAHLSCIKMVHTTLYDGDPHKDLVRGLGWSFAVPLSGELYNRYVRFAGDTGLFAEAARLLPAPRFRKWFAEYQKQLAGHALKLSPSDDLTRYAAGMPAWDDFRLLQLSADHYTLSKRTKEECCWVEAAHGRRAPGLAFAGGPHGGLAVGLRHFWQKCPSALAVKGLLGEEVAIQAWLWPPEALAMDLRHYDTVPHVAAAYEGFEEMRATPVGIGNTNELGLWCFGEMPGNERLLSLAATVDDPPLLVCEPSYYHGTKVFGVWSLANRDTAARALIEECLDAAIEFVADEIEQRRWYGFWHYGDIMHSYDAGRHCWRYDTGGFAWMNAELVPNLWLWYSFLRSGRPDVFRLAEAMTWHTSEVDVYHFGEYAGLGSRHNVVHWGCGCKEARVSMAGLHRIYYYLTGDDRIGDIMREVRDADYATERLDPMRAYFAPGRFPTHARSGPDWASFTSNWMTEWERFEDTTYRDKILVGVECLKRMPLRLLSGPTFGYVPTTGQLLHMGDENYSHHMILAFGAPYVWTELATLLQDPDWERMLAEFADREWRDPVFFAGMMAYAARLRQDHSLAKRAWAALLTGDNGRMMGLPEAIASFKSGIHARKVREIPWVSTGFLSQWSLNAIMCLELISTALPAAIEAARRQST